MEQLKKYLCIDSELRKKYADCALQFEHRTLVVFMRIVIFLFPIYASIFFFFNPAPTRIDQFGLISTFLYSLFTHFCICYIRKRSDARHVNAMRIFYSAITFIYLYAIGTLIEISYILIYTVLLCTSICFINPTEYKLLVFFSLILPDLLFYFLAGASYWENIYYMLDTLVVSVGAAIINQFYAMDRYRLFDLESRLRNDRNIDGLTSLSNKRYFQERLGDYDNTRQLGCAVLIDLDHFKQVNDTFGHDYGDAVLQQAAHILQGVFRDEDFLSRIGGDEFAAFFIADVSAQQLLELLQEKIHSILKQVPIVISKEHQTVEVTFSIGTYIHSIDDTHTPQDILSAADAAMYQIKNAGRNGACLICEDSSTLYLFSDEKRSASV